MYTNHDVELFAVVVCPSHYKEVRINGDSLDFKNVEMMGFSHSPHSARINRGMKVSRPHTMTWFMGHFGLWILADEHRNKPSGACECGNAKCHDLGIVNTSNEIVMRMLDQSVQARRSWLSKRQAQLEKARAKRAAAKGA